MVKPNSCVRIKLGSDQSNSDFGLNWTRRVWELVNWQLDQGLTNNDVAK